MFSKITAIAKRFVKPKDNDPFVENGFKLTHKSTRYAIYEHGRYVAYSFYRDDIKMWGSMLAIVKDGQQEAIGGENIHATKQGGADTVLLAMRQHMSELSKGLV